MMNDEQLKIAYENRKKINEKIRKNLINTEMTILSSNCIGGMLYHDFGLKFLSPTINLYFRTKDFYKFVNDLDYYISLTPKVLEETPFPVLKLDDIKLYCRHYESGLEAIECWERRKTRINKNNIFIIATDQYCDNIEDLLMVDKLPYNKVVFTVDHELEIYNKCLLKKDSKDVGHLDRFVDETGIREYETVFDFVGWFNENF